MTNRLWVLGAADPEMAAIASLLAECGEPVTYAVGPDGQRVHPGNAYRADRVIDNCPFTSLEPGDVVYEVECALRPRIAGVEHVTIGHHRPGDPGYGRPPEEFLPASSIGQVISELARLDRLPGHFGSTMHTHDRRAAVGDFLLFDDPLEHQRVKVHGCPAWAVVTYTGKEYVGGVYLPAAILLTAAADHCLEAAYRGRCPGVDPDALMRRDALMCSDS